MLPQELLGILALPPEQRPANTDDWVRYRFSLYGCGAQALLLYLPAGLVAKTHEFLSQQYLAQRKVPLEKRVLPVANSVLVQEARYHEEQAQQARLRLAQQPSQHSVASPVAQWLEEPAPLLPMVSQAQQLTQQQPRQQDYLQLSPADLEEIAHHQQRFTDTSPFANPYSHAFLIRKPCASFGKNHAVVAPFFHEQWHPVLAGVTAAQTAFTKQQWQVSQASLQEALAQLEKISHQSQYLQAAIHSRLAYVAAIHQQWGQASTHQAQAQALCSSTEIHPYHVWIDAQLALADVLLPDAVKPHGNPPLAMRLVTILKQCEAQAIATPIGIEVQPAEDLCESFWHAVLPPATLMAELTFRTATLLDADKSIHSASPYSASQLYEEAYTRLLETHQPFAAASAAANRAALFAETHAYEQAIPWLQRALNLEEANDWTDEAAESHQRLAKAYAKTQQWQSALHHGDCVLRWIQANTNDPSNVSTLANWQQRLGQWAKTGGFHNQAKVYWLSALQTLYEYEQRERLTPQQQRQKDDLESALRQGA